MNLILMCFTSVTLCEDQEVPFAVRRFVTNWNATARRNRCYDPQVSEDTPAGVDKTVQSWLVNFLTSAHREPGMKTMLGSTVLEYLQFNWTQSPLELNTPLHEGAAKMYERQWAAAIPVEALLKTLDTEIAKNDPNAGA